MANPAYSTRYKLPDGRLAVNVTENKTLAAEDSGIVQNVITAGVTVTAPAVATQGVWTVRDGGVPVTSGPSGAVVSPANPTVDVNASDTLAGLNVEGTEADGKYLQVPSATAAIGDEISFANTGATNGGLVLPGTKGDWQREA
ncbi:hypothetical protein [Caudoviricetes sp.]|nr:hypothetical protein [Caudoviricetes sp.]